MSRNVLRLQMSHDATLWYGTDRNMALPSPLSVAEFLDVEFLGDRSEIQLFGSIRNASLVESLYTAKQRGELPADLPIRLGSPAGCPVNA